MRCCTRPRSTWAATLTWSAAWSPPTGRPGRAAALPPERGGRGPVAVRLLAGAARPAHAGGPHGARLCQRACHRLLARRTAGGRAASTTRACATTRSTSSARVRCACPAPWSASSSHADDEPARRFVACTRLFTLAESLGAVESLIELPAAMTHLSVADSPLAVPPGSCGCRSASRSSDDLIADLEAAFAGPASAPHEPRSRVCRLTGPTELVEGRDGEMVERLSTGTATLLLAWLIGDRRGERAARGWLLAALFLRRAARRGRRCSARGLLRRAVRRLGPDAALADGPRAGPLARLVLADRREDRAGHDRQHHRASSRSARIMLGAQPSAAASCRWSQPCWQRNAGAQPWSGRWPPGRQIATSRGPGSRVGAEAG